MQQLDNIEENQFLHDQYYASRANIEAFMNEYIKENLSYNEYI